MGWSVSSHSEPSRKLNLLEKRLCRLRGAVRAGEGPTHVSKAAEKVRLAALAVIKAKLALIREYPQRDPEGRESSKLRDEEPRWRSLSTEAIVEENGRAES
jgi:hypothetical protein